TLLRGNGGGQFTSAGTYPGNTYPHIMRAADLDGDGLTDLAAPNNGTNYFTVLRNVGGTSLAAPLQFTSGGVNVRTMAVGDYNEDGRPDVAVGNEGSGTLSLFLNSSPLPAPSGVAVRATVRGRLDLSWVDNSVRESGFQIERRTATSGFTRRASVGANVTSYLDS